MEYFKFEDPIDWEEHKKLPVQVRLRIMPQTVEDMHAYSLSKAMPGYSSKKYKKNVSFWHFKRFLILNELYQQACESGIKEEEDYFYKLFRAYQDRQENNFGKYGPSSHGMKHPFRNTYEHKYTNKK